MKTLLFTVLATVLAVSAQAQNSDKPIATLEQGDSTQVFEGENAFINAYAAAASSGAVIRLSPGTFLPLTTEVNKSFSLYGAGFENDSVTATNATYVSGNIAIVNCSNIHIEGIRFTGGVRYGDYNSRYYINNLTVKRCRFTNIGSNYGKAVANFTNCSFLQCVITDAVYGNGSSVADGLYFNNCWIGGSVYGFTETSANLICSHCIFPSTTRSVSYGYYDCIFRVAPTISDGTNGMADHCVFGGDAPSLRATNCWANISVDSIFASGTLMGTYTEGTDFSLAEPEKYVGSDDTQVGLYGGQFNWNGTTLPSIPRITSLKTTLDPVGGVLHVDMKAEAVE